MIVVAKSGKRGTKKGKEKVIDETPPSPSLSDATEMRSKNKKSKNSSRLKKRRRPAWEGEDEERDESVFEDDDVADGTAHESIHEDEEESRIGKELDHDREHSTHDREEDVHEREETSVVDENPHHTNLDDVASSPVMKM